MKKYRNETERYSRLNKIAEGNGVVIFGSAFADSIPVGELKQDYELSFPVYNRSIAGLSAAEAAELLEECVLPLYPHKLILNFGDTESGSTDEIINGYSRLIDRAKALLGRCRIVVASVCDGNEDTEELNSRLAALAKSKGCGFADITSALKTSAPTIRAFEMLRFFMPDRLSFCGMPAID